MSQPSTSKENSCCLNKWRIIPIAVVFLITIAVLLSVYRLRSDVSSLPTSTSSSSSRHSTRAGGTRSRSKDSKGVWEEGRTNDRWLVVTDDQDHAFICALSGISAELEWRMLVVGNNISCCRKTCVLLDDGKLKSFNYEILSAMEPTAKVEARRNAGYIYAIRHGARHIFDAYPETYISAKIPIEVFKREMLRQLQNVALNVALGVVSERPYVKRVQNPYAHFGRPDLWTEGFRRNNQRFIHNHIYRICEVRPPSIEKFLDIDEDYFDWAAPSLTLPGSTVAPFSSKNTLYSIEAFWGLVLFPSGNSSAIPPHLLRTLWNQALLGDIAGSLKLSLANVSTLQRRDKTRKNPADLREPDGLASFLLKWTCSTRSSLSCSRDLIQNMFQFHYISSKSLEFFESWINDLQRSHYLEPPVIPRRRGQMNPCLGADGLYGVAFYPALPARPTSAEQTYRRNITLQRYRKEEGLLTDNRAQPVETVPTAIDDDGGSGPSDLVVPGTQGPVVVLAETEELHDIGATKEDEEPVLASSDAEGSHESPIMSRHAKLYDGHGTLEMPIVREFTDNICPGYSQLLPHSPAEPLNNILLIVAMTAMRYEMIPVFEVVYREHFRNILYCGSPHDSIEIFLRKYQLSEDRSFSFLPIHSKYTYECLLGALEMGYNVDGWIMTTDDALINSWNLGSMNYSKLWYSGDYDIEVNSANWQTLDPGSQKLPRSLDGVQKVLEFLKSSLIGSVLPDDGTTVGGLGHHDYLIGESRLIKREAVIEGIRTPILDQTFLERADLRSNQTSEASRDEETPLTSDPPSSKIALQPLNLHSTTGRLLFDVIELKSVASSNKVEEQTTKNLSSLNYVVDAQNNNTRLSNVPHHQDPLVALSNTSEVQEPLSEPKSINFTGTVDVISLLPPNFSQPEGQQETEVDPLADVDAPTSTINASVIEEEDSVPSFIDDEESEEEQARPVSEVLRQLLVATRNTTSPAVEVESPMKNDSVPSEPSIVLVDNVHENSTVASLEISISILTSPDVTEEKNKSRENPVIDLFLHPIVVNSSSDVSPQADGLPNSQDVSEPAMAEVTEKLEIINIQQADVQQENKTVELPTRFNESTIRSITQQHDVFHEVASTTRQTITPKSTTQSSVTAEEERKIADTLHIEETLSTLKELYSSIKENLGVPSDDVQVASYTDDATFYGGDRGYRLNPKWIHHFRCEKGTNLEFCKVSSEFLYQLSENIGKDFRLIYDKVPMYYIPKRDQLKFYLLSNLMLQHGVTDEIAIPLMLSGLDPKEEWVKLDKSYFGEMKGRNGEATPNKYPLFDGESAVLFPTDLNAVTTDPKFQKVFCLKYLLRLLQL